MTVPAAIVKEMGLEPGTRLEWLKGDVPGVIIIKVQPTVRQMLARIQELGAEMKREMGPDWDPVEELMLERERDMIDEEQDH